MNGYPSDRSGAQQCSHSASTAGHGADEFDHGDDDTKTIVTETEVYIASQITDCNKA